ncbi:MAG: hypothetical protein BGO11_13355 [Solirubrobacterales bacterium 70-9]|nr:MAG: hypothetical protein BGO11_13355 [Solirubrobacterales bacterium 70-9]
MIDNKPGVLQQERERHRRWTDLGLPDPVTVEAEERQTALLTGRPFTSPRRAQLDAHFAQHPEDEPDWWKE